MTAEDRAKFYMKLVLTAQLVLESLEQLSNTNQYRQKLKYHGKEFTKELDKLLNEELEKHYGKNEEVTLNVTKNLEELSAKIPFLDPIQICLLNQYLPDMLDSFKDKSLTWQKIK